LFQNSDLDSLHVRLGNNHLLAKGRLSAQTHDKEKNLPLLPYFPIQFEIGLI